MFVPQTSLLRAVADRYPHIVAAVDEIFGTRKTGIYIDWANVRNWSEMFHWHVDPEKLKKLIDSFTPIKYPRFYWGTLANAPKSGDTIALAEEIGFLVRTKPVKRIPVSVNVSSSPPESPVILKKLISEHLLRLLREETIVELNGYLRELNKAGILYFENLKCNFDVEIATDMRTDGERNGVENFLLWSGDSDFADVLERLLMAGKTATVFSTRGRIASELHELRPAGLKIFEVQRLREFLCWNREKQIRQKTRI